MRKLIGVVLVLAALYAGYWVVGAQALKSQMNKWIETQRRDGVTVEYDSLAVRGFPSRFDVTVQGLDLYDPHSGMGWKIPFFQALALSYQPQHYIAVWDHDQTLRLPSGDVDIRSSDLRASLVFAPASRFRLRRMSLVGADLLVDAGDGLTFSASSLRFATEPAPLTENGHHVGLDVTALELPRVLREGWGLGADMPDTLDRVHLDVTLEFDAPLDARVIDGPRPHLTRISIAPSAISWGPLELRAHGDLQVDSFGQPEGSLQIEASQWRRILDLLVAAGAVQPANRTMIEAALVFASAGSPDPESFSAPLNFKDGKMAFGALPLGDAPVLKLP